MESSRCWSRSFGFLGDPCLLWSQVEQVDRVAPSLDRLESPSIVTDLGAGRYGIFITSTHLRGSDPDSPAELLEFSIITPPQFGSLENAATGSAISRRFTQRDLDRRSVLYVVPVDVDVTSDGFWFRLVDLAGNRTPPHRLELFWSRVQLSASCYRTCETSGTLQIQIQRGGRSADPAYVSIQAEDGSAKAGRDFTHSSAALIQFDAGVNVKTWSVFLLDDGLEENHEAFSVALSNPQNAVMGQRNTATVEIIDPRSGRCDPEDLKVQSALLPPHPQPQEEEDEDPVTDIEAELLWEKQPHPPRGDVPHRQPSLDEAEPQDQALPGVTHSLEGRLQGARTGSTGSTGLQKALTPSSACHEGWTAYRGRCHMVSRSVASWASAHRTCSLLFNSSLSSVRSRKEAAWMWRLAGRKSFWIGQSGGHDLWVWDNGHSARLQGAPASRDEAGFGSDCVLVENPRRWIPTNCSAEAQHSFICSSEPPP